MVWKVSAGGPGIYTPGFGYKIIDPKTGDEMETFEMFRRFGDPFKSGKPHPEPCLVPESVTVRRVWKRFPKIVSATGGFCGTREFVDFVESFEPGVHEFFPIELVHEKTGEVMAKQYHLMNICNLLESVVLDHPSVRTEQFGDWTSWEQITGKISYVFHRDVVEGHHIWRDKGAPVFTYFSDEFTEALEKEIPKGWIKYRHYEEI